MRRSAYDIKHSAPARNSNWMVYLSSLYLVVWIGLCGGSGGVSHLPSTRTGDPFKSKSKPLVQRDRTKEYQANLPFPGHTSTPIPTTSKELPSHQLTWKCKMAFQQESREVLFLCDVRVYAFSERNNQTNKPNQSKPNQTNTYSILALFKQTTKQQENIRPILLWLLEWNPGFFAA